MHRAISGAVSGGGNPPEDYAYLKISYRRNRWGALVNERMPHVMYGQGHQFDNYFNAPGNLYCIGVGSYGPILVENNYFKDVQSPHVFMYDGYMYAEASGYFYGNTTGSRDTGMGGSRDVAGSESLEPGSIDPPYEYTLDPAGAVFEIAALRGSAINRTCRRYRKGAFSPPPIEVKNCSSPECGKSAI